MDSKTPGQQAAQDQSDKTFENAVLAQGIALALHSNDGIAHVSEPTGRDLEAKEKFFAWMQGTPAYCVHQPLAPGRPMAHWSLWNQQFHCSACFEASHTQIAGTPEDRRCDFCGVIQPPGPGCLITGAYVVQVPPSSIFEVWPPIIIHYGICRSCAGGE